MKNSRQWQHSPGCGPQTQSSHSPESSSPPGVSWCSGGARAEQMTGEDKNHLHANKEVIGGYGGTSSTSLLGYFSTKLSNPQGAVHQILWSQDIGKCVSREAVKAKSILLPQDLGKQCCWGQGRSNYSPLVVEEEVHITDVCYYWGETITVHNRGSVRAGRRPSLWYR